MTISFYRDKSDATRKQVVSGNKSDGYKWEVGFKPMSPHSPREIPPIFYLGPELRNSSALPIIRPAGPVEPLSSTTDCHSGTRRGAARGRMQPTPG